MTAATFRGSFGIRSAAAAYRCFTAATGSAYAARDARTGLRLEDAKLVRRPPGSRQVTLMPNDAVSAARASDHAASAAFDAEYIAVQGKPIVAASDETLTTCPLRWPRNQGSTVRVSCRAAKKLTAIRSFASSSEVSSTAPIREWPALLTSTSSPPSRSTATGTRVETALSSA